MVTKDGITIKRVDGYSDGPAVSFRSGDINLVVLRGYKNKEQRYLVSVFAHANDGHPRYMQFWTDKANAKQILKNLKG